MAFGGISARNDDFGDAAVGVQSIRPESRPAFRKIRTILASASACCRQKLPPLLLRFVHIASIANALQEEGEGTKRSLLDTRLWADGFRTHNERYRKPARRRRGLWRFALRHSSLSRRVSSNHEDSCRPRTSGCAPRHF